MTNTSIGNNAETYENWDTANPFKVGHDPATASPTREYRYAWTNQWFEESCDPAVFESPERNDIDAAIANLFAMHDRMHDFAYSLGFTETAFNLQYFNFGLGGKDHDPEVGSAQAGGIVGGPPGSRHVTTRTRSRRRTACRPTRPCNCGSRSPAPSTRLAWTATST